MAVGALDPANYAQDDGDADGRFETWRHRDPFPEIRPALLNIADLLDYIRVTGMIAPFAPNAQTPDTLLKPASCAIAMGGEYLYWEEAPDPIYGGVKTVARREVLTAN